MLIYKTKGTEKKVATNEEKGKVLAKSFFLTKPASDT